MSKKEKFPQELLVEGNDDLHVLWALCENFKLVENFEIIDTKGIRNKNLRYNIRC
jgi:hypothetical protein